MISDYGLIANRGAAGLVGRNGSIDWLCVPRFDSSACFAALLGAPENGRWLLAPARGDYEVERQYRHGTTVLETMFHNSQGRVVLVDAMDRRGPYQDVLRLLKCTSGRLSMHLELTLRFDYGLIWPRLENVSQRGCDAVAGPDRFGFRSDVHFSVGDSGTISADFDIEAGQELAFSLTWAPSHGDCPPPKSVPQAIAGVTRWWTDWAQRFQPNGDWSEAELRSLITLQALTDQETGGFVAAATTSLPESLGGDKNWDYRFCWLRDGAFALRALIDGGFQDEAKTWRTWLLRAIAGSPDKMQIMYGLKGERNLQERELPWLNGYENSRPVREGNAASGQFQLDIYGQVLDVFFQSRKAGVDTGAESWDLEKALLDSVLRLWRNPGAGIWELRLQHQQFTQSKIMAWAALDRGIRSIEQFGFDGPVEDWRKARADIHDEICRAGFNNSRNSFVQYYGGDTLDASLLLLPLFDFLPADDPRVLGTVSAIEAFLLRDGLVMRYRNYGDAAKPEVREGAFLPCSFWLVDNYVLQGRIEEARELFERLLTLRNDLGLLSEEYDLDKKQMIGNYPQALTHTALVTSAHNLARVKGKNGIEQAHRAS